MATHFVQNYINQLILEAYSPSRADIDWGPFGNPLRPWRPTDRPGDRVPGSGDYYPERGPFPQGPLPPDAEPWRGPKPTEPIGPEPTGPEITPDVDIPIDPKPDPTEVDPETGEPFDPGDYGYEEDDVEDVVIPPVVVPSPAPGDIGDPARPGYIPKPRVPRQFTPPPLPTFPNVRDLFEPGSDTGDVPWWYLLPFVLPIPGNPLLGSITPKSAESVGSKPPGTVG